MHRLNELIIETLQDDDARETAVYIVQRSLISLAAQRSMSLGHKEIQQISAEQISLVMQYDSMTAINPFFTTNYAMIKAALALEDLNLDSISKYAAKDCPNKDAFLILRGLTTNRFSTLSLVVMLSEGMEAAKKFNYKLKEITKLTPEEKKVFDEIIK